MAAPRVERRLAAIVAADVVGYSRLVGRDEAGTLARLKAHRRELIEPLIAAHNGRLVKLMGDGALAEFGSVVDAVACAVAIQEGMAGREAGVPEGERIRLRIGINLGDVVVDGDDLYGDGVNVAARLEQLAEPGGVTVSGTAFDHLGGRFDLPLDFAGEQRVKNIARPVRAYRVRMGGGAGRSRGAGRRPPAFRRAAAAGLALVALGALAAGGWWWRGEARDARPAAGSPAPAVAALPEKPWIAVLPFASDGDDPRGDRLAEGFTDDLITELARFRRLFVVGRSSSFTYRGEAVDVRRVGGDLGVRFVLEGALRTDPERVRVTVQLLDAATGAQVWAERYDRPAAEFFAVSDEVVREVAATLAGFEGPVDRAGLEIARRKAPASLEAYDLYLLAKEPYGRRDAAGVAEARGLLERAVAQDPDYAPAWALLADTLLDEALLGWAADVPAARERAHAAAGRAAALDPLDSNAQRALGTSHFARGEPARGAAAWERALAVNPNNAGLLRIIGSQMAVALGTERAREGLELVRLGLRLNPQHPPWYERSLGFAAYYAGEYAEAAAALERVGPLNIEGRLYLALAYAQLGRTADAAAQVAEILRERPGFTARAWADNHLFQPGSSSEALFLDGARKAGLPIDAPRPG